MIGTRRISNSQAIPVDGLRLPGMTPSATIRRPISRTTTTSASAVRTQPTQESTSVTGTGAQRTSARHDRSDIGGRLDVRL